MIRSYLANETQVRISLDRRGEAIEREFKGGIGRLTIRLQKMVKSDKLRGQVLGWRTGRLNNSIAQGVIDEGAKVVGVVSTNVSYGIGWETGWTGSSGRAAAPDKWDMSAAKAKFSPASADTFKNGTPKKRSFLASALRDLEASGIIGTELDAAIKRALA